MCYTGAQLGDREDGGGSLPCLFWKSRKKPWFSGFCVHHCKIFLVFLTKCLSSVIIPLNLPWKISGCTPASFFYEHSISLVRYHYVIFQYYFFRYHLCTILLLLITEGVIQPNMIVMIFPEIDETTWTGEMQDSQ